MSTVACPTCGATGDQFCSTVRGNDHRKRMLLEIQQPFSSTPCTCILAGTGLHPVEPCPVHGRSVR